MTDGIEVIETVEVESVDIFWPIFFAAFLGAAAAVSLIGLVALLLI